MRKPVVRCGVTFEVRMIWFKTPKPLWYVYLGGIRLSRCEPTQAKVMARLAAGDFDKFAPLAERYKALSRAIAGAKGRLARSA